MKKNKVTYEAYRDMDCAERNAVTCLDMSGCDFRHIYVYKTLRFAENLQEVILSDTVLDPGGGGGTFVDDDGVICWWGEGNTPSHAYENRVPVRTPFAKASDRERRAYLGLSAIGEKYLQNLELRDVILEIADDLYYDCQIDEYTQSTDPRDIAWERKYVFVDYPNG